MPITPVDDYEGGVPLRSQDQSTFDGNMGALLTWLASFPGDLNNRISEINATSEQVGDDAAAAEAARAGAEAVAALMNFQGTYNAGTSYSIGQSVVSSGIFYLSLVGSNLGNTPASSPSQWQRLGGVTPDYQQFTSSGTWTKPSGAYTFVYVEAIGGGGAGAKGDSSGPKYGQGGGGGEFACKILRFSDVGATETVTIGAGGAAQTSLGTAGNSGGNTTFGAHLTARGGRGGYPQQVTSQVYTNRGGYGGDGTAPAWANNGEVIGGGGYSCGSGATSGQGGYATMGGAGGGGGYDGANGGTSQNGGNGGAGRTGATAAIAGSAPGGGGGGSYTGTSGAGAAGRVRVWTF